MPFVISMDNCYDTSCEPMDVDISSNSANNSITEEPLDAANTSNLLNKSIDISEGPVSQTLIKQNILSNKPEEWSVKKYHIVRKTDRGLNTSIKFLLLASFVLPLAVIIYSIYGIQCTNNLDLKKLKVKMNARLYGQREVIENFIDALSREDKSKILFLYGGTGVGKTFASTLTFEDYWNSSNIYHYTMPSFLTTFSTEIMLGLNICDTSIVVVDDLKQNDFQVKEQIKEIISKSENINKKITVILIYNCDIIAKGFIKKCDSTFYSELSQAFEDIEAYKRFIEFKPLTQEVLRLCIEDELKDESISDLQFENLFHNFNVTLDGCKGVYKKIKFLNLL